MLASTRVSTDRSRIQDRQSTPAKMTTTTHMKDGPLNGFNDLRIPDIIIKKRDGKQLSQKEIDFFVREVVNGSIQGAQLGALLMAMFIRDLDNEETTSLTRAMTHSGEVLTWPKEWKGSIVDKHSTGGVGDKVSLVLAPALAACGCKVPMVSGRGLSHTGGTLDKLESIPGFTVALSHAQMTDVLEDVGCCIVSQTKSLAPADKIIYGVRDVTGTTENIGLIASSIISKKMAELLDTLVLDVKVGAGALLNGEHLPRELAIRMVRAGNGMGVKTAALLTNMDAPIGNMVGNALEVVESIQTLQGEGPDDLVELTTRLGAQLLFDCGKAGNINEAQAMINEALQDGSALAKFCSMMKRQGVDPGLADKLCEKGTDLFECLPKAKHITKVRSQTSGFVHSIDAMNCAIVSGKLGAGRSKAGDLINFAVGLELTTAVGQSVSEGDVLIKVHHDSEEVPERMLSSLQKSFLIQSDGPVNKTTSRIIDIIT